MRAVTIASAFAHPPPHPGFAEAANELLVGANCEAGTSTLTHPSPWELHAHPSRIIVSGVHGFGSSAGGVSVAGSGMGRILWLVGGSVAVVAAGVGVALWFQPGSTDGSSSKAIELLLVPCDDLPRAVFERGEYVGRSVRVGFELPLTPTADPLSWEYRPGIPPTAVPAVYRIHFERPPEFGRSMPVLVVGTVSRFEPDTRRRLNRVPGVVVITGASVAVQSSP